MPQVVVAFYKFVSLPDYVTLRDALFEELAAAAITGSIILALEGINGTIAGSATAIERAIAYLRNDPRLADLIVKESYANDEAFDRLKVRLKREIVALGRPEINPNDQVGTYVTPADWNALIADPEVLVIDTRNDFEVGIGSFRGAQNPQTQRFGEFPDYVGEHCDPAKHKKIAMFCTGGIRCEKASSYMLSQGFEQVYHLEGGILKYLETVPVDESQWEGECFVFDRRVSVSHGLVQGDLVICPSCGHPVSPTDRQSPLYEVGISCPGCHETLTDRQRQRFSERQHQRELQEQRAMMISIDPINQTPIDPPNSR
jgi:UPF0176 protein